MDKKQKRDKTSRKMSLPAMEYRPSWVARLFDYLGAIFIAMSIILLVKALFTEELRFYLVLTLTVFGTGLVYTAAAEIIRSVGESAYNTRMLLAIKRRETDR